MPLGKHWNPEDWTEAKYAAVWEELKTSNPLLDIPFLPSFIGTLSNLKMKGRNHAGMIVTIRRNAAGLKALADGFIYAYGRTHYINEFVSRYHTQICGRCLKQGHNEIVCRDPASCKFCGGPYASANHRCTEVHCTAKGKMCSHVVPVCRACTKEGHIQGGAACQIK
jgi:hypothetical protein